MLWHHASVPVTFLAHQAPVLPLKRRWAGLDGVALVAGSMAPDLAVATQHATPRLLLGQPLWWDGHSVAQQFNWCLPVGLLLTFLLRRLVLPGLAPYLPDGGTFHLQDLRLVARTRHRWWVICGSVLIGSFSHILVDGFTHPDGWAVGVVPGLSPGVASVGQAVASVALSVVAVWQLWLIGRDREVCRWSGVEPGPPVRPPWRSAVRAAAVAVPVVAAVWAGTQWERGRTVVVMTWFVLAVAGWSLLAAGVLRSARRRTVDAVPAAAPRP